MPSITWASVGAFLSALVTSIFTTIVSTLKASYEASHKWFAVGCVIFILLVWFGYAHLPTFASKDTALEKQIAALTAKIDSLPTKADLAALKPASIITGSIKKKR